MEAWFGVVSIVVGAVVGALTGTIGTLVTTRQKVSLEQRVAHDRHLQDLRLPHYQRLYHLSMVLPREWLQDELPTRADLLRIREAFHRWYFGDEPGGLFLTEEGREAYFNLMNQLQSIGDPAHGGAAMSAEESSRIRSLASTLRHQLVSDLGTAEPPTVRWTRLGPTPAPPARR